VITRDHPRAPVITRPTIITCPGFPAGAFFVRGFSGGIHKD
jgi:hypothetical protein